MVSGSGLRLRIANNRHSLAVSRPFLVGGRAPRCAAASPASIIGCSENLSLSTVRGSKRGAGPPFQVAELSRLPQPCLARGEPAQSAAEAVGNFHAPAPAARRRKQDSACESNVFRKTNARHHLQRKSRSQLDPPVTFPDYQLLVHLDTNPLLSPYATAMTIPAISIHGLTLAGRWWMDCEGSRRRNRRS